MSRKRKINGRIYDTIPETHMKHPFTCIVAGPTSCGKSSWVAQLLKNQRKIIPSPEKIVWCYSEWQQLYDTISDVEFVEGILDIKSLDKNLRTLLIIDDLMSEKNDTLTKLFTKDSHHRNISVLYITQNIFDQEKGRRTMSLNAQYMVAFKNPRDRGQISILARQMFPSLPDYMPDAFDKATSVAHGYLFIDLTQSTDDAYRLRTSVFGRPGCPLKSEVVYREDPIKRRRIS